jgi:hypothetical protein
MDDTRTGFFFLQLQSVLVVQFGVCVVFNLGISR